MKHADVYLKGYADLSKLTLRLTEYFPFYNDERPHQALADETPATVYRTRQGGGARIVDNYGPAATPPGEPAAPGQRCSAASEAQTVA